MSHVSLILYVVPMVNNSLQLLPVIQQYNLQTLPKLIRIKSQHLVQYKATCCHSPLQHPQHLSQPATSHSAIVDQSIEHQNNGTGLLYQTAMVLGQLSSIHNVVVTLLDRPTPTAIQQLIATATQQGLIIDTLSELSMQDKYESFVTSLSPTSPKAITENVPQSPDNFETSTQVELAAKLYNSVILIEGTIYQQQLQLLNQLLSTINTAPEPTDFTEIVTPELTAANASYCSQIIMLIPLDWYWLMQV